MLSKNTEAKIAFDFLGTKILLSILNTKTCDGKAKIGTVIANKKPCNSRISSEW